MDHSRPREELLRKSPRDHRVFKLQRTANEFLGARSQRLLNAGELHLVAFDRQRFRRAGLRGERDAA